MINDPDAIAEPTFNVLPTDELLEKGHPGEILPGRQLSRLKDLAVNYVKDQTHDEDARKRVEEVWLKGLYRPAWQKFTPRAGKEHDFG